MTGLVVIVARVSPFSVSIPRLSPLMMPVFLWVFILTLLVLVLKSLVGGMLFGVSGPLLLLLC